MMYRVAFEEFEDARPKVLYRLSFDNGPMMPPRVVYAVSITQEDVETAASIDRYEING